MKLTEIVSRLKGLVKKTPAKPAKAGSPAKAGEKKVVAKRSEVKRARKAAGTTRKRG